MKSTQSWGILLTMAGMTVILKSNSIWGYTIFGIGSVLFLLGSVNDKWPRVMLTK